MTVFLIDDDSEEAELFFDAIQKIDRTIKLHTFTSGLDALEEIKLGTVPDIIFLDLNMPLLSGKEILKRLRLDITSAPIAVVIYSTSISKKDIDDVAQYQVTSHLQKPEDFNSLCNALKELLSGS